VPREMAGSDRRVKCLGTAMTGREDGAVRADCLRCERRLATFTRLS
jgi:hypothetical protein